MAYLIGIYLNYGFLDRGKGAENLQKKRRKQIKKHWQIKRKKNEEYRESQTTTRYIFGFAFYVRNYILL